jgi:hypothetical protein
LRKKQTADNLEDGQGKVHARMAQGQPECNRRKAAEVARRVRSRAPQATLRSRGSGQALLGPDLSPRAQIGPSRPPRATAGQSNVGRRRHCIQASCRRGRNDSSGRGRRHRAAPPRGRAPSRRVQKLAREEKTAAVGTARTLPSGSRRRRWRGRGATGWGRAGGGGGAPAAHGGATGAREDVFLGQFWIRSKMIEFF